MALLARTLANQGKLADALGWCEKAIAAERINPVHYYLAGTILQNQQEPEKAMQALQKALYLDQNFALAHFTLGRITRQLGRITESERHMRNALSLLAAMNKEEAVPESDGMTAGRLAEIVQSMQQG
jgi:chemotaxis protein methyltransferase CheR